MGTHLASRLGLVLLLSASTLASAAEGGDRALESHADRVTTFATLGQQVIGPLPAVASTPFFGLAVLSGVGLATRTELVRDTRWSWLARVRDNALVAEARRYSTVPRFLALAALALVGYLANSGKLQGFAGKTFRVLEDSSVLVGYTLLAIAAMPGDDADAKVTQMGVAGGASLLIPLATTLALGAMMAVRFAFDVLIWLSPVPLVDLMFETAKKVLTLGVLLLYIWSPGLAAVVCLVTLIATALAGAWAFRVLEFYRRVLLNPALASLVPAFFPRLFDEQQARRDGLDPQALTLAAPAVVLSLRGLPRRTGGIVVAGAEGCRFVARGLRGRSIHALGQRPGERLELGRTLLWLELRVVGADGVRDRIAFSRALEPSFDAIQIATGAGDVGSLGARGLLETAGEVAGRALADAEDALR